MDDFDDLVLDTDVPIPADTRTRKYPWLRFKPSNSLFFGIDDADDSVKRLKQRLDQSSRTFGKKQNPEWKFTARVVLENEVSGVRVWRTE